MTNRSICEWAGPGQGSACTWDLAGAAAGPARCTPLVALWSPLGLQQSHQLLCQFLLGRHVRCGTPSSSPDYIMSWDKAFKEFRNVTRGVPAADWMRKYCAVPFLPPRFQKWKTPARRCCQHLVRNASSRAESHKAIGAMEHEQGEQRQRRGAPGSLPRTAALGVPILFCCSPARRRCNLHYQRVHIPPEATCSRYPAAPAANPAASDPSWCQSDRPARCRAAATASSPARRPRTASGRPRHARTGCAPQTSECGSPAPAAPSDFGF